MIHPQTKAETIGKYGCLAMCYLYCAGIEPDDNYYFQSVSRAMDLGILDDECTVLDASKYIRFISGKKATVTKRTISDISEIKEKSPVRFDNNGYSHWVVVENGKIIFNSISRSVCVAKGKPTTARIIQWG